MSARQFLFQTDWLKPDRLRRIAWAWVAAATLAAGFRIWSETRIGLTNGHGIPLGEDFINFWSGAVLAAGGHAHTVYDFNIFHAFQQALVAGPIQLYHYSYPPVMLMISRALAFLPYIPALLLWSLTGLAAFAFALRLVWPSPAALLYGLAIPATFINLMDGQNGLGTAAILGAGLCWLPRRPIVSGILFGLLLACKPQLALLLPLALLAERNWRALGAMVASSALLVTVTLPLYGWTLWTDYRERVTILRHAILENDAGTWRLMPSAFIMARSLSLSIVTAYAVQAVVTLTVSALVVWIWRRRDQARPIKNAILILCLLLASPYVQNYDLIAAAFVPVWLLMGLPEKDPRRPIVFLAAILLLIAPMMGSVLMQTTGVAWGWLMLVPPLWIAWRQSLPAIRFAPNPVADLPG
jgi:arabinofuranan 3-O-arabinosyltransferase